MMKIAYQGERFSNSEFAAKQLVKMLDLSDATLVPRRTSERVVDSLRRGEADFGVVAVRNSTFGDVEETARALDGLNSIEHATCDLPIHHHLFSLAEDVTADKLTHVYSHPQALGQCKRTLGEIAPNAQLNSSQDTSFAAEQLKDGNYSETSGVVCRRESGEHYGLSLLRSNVEDETGNSTTFKIISLRASNAIPTVPARDRMANLVCRPFFVRWAIGGVLTAAIFATLLLNAYVGWSAWTISTTIVGTLGTVLLTMTSPKYVLWSQQRRILGFWKYRPIPKRENAPADEKHDIERIVIIDRVNGELRLRGWQSGDGDAHRWQSDGTLFKHSTDTSGQLVYQYRNTLSHQQSTLVGIVSLYWNTSDPAQLVTDMSGLYYGHGTTQDDGTMNYQRISQDEFERLRYAKPKVPASADAKVETIAT